MTQDMNFKAKYSLESENDIFHSIVSPAWDGAMELVYDPEKTLEFVESLDEAQRYSLVCWTFEAELYNGGFDIVFSVMGLLLPELLKALEFYNALEQRSVILKALQEFDFNDYPRNNDEVQELWYEYSDKHSPDMEAIELAEKKLWELDNKNSLRGIIEHHVKENMSLYFFNAE